MEVKERHSAGISTVTQIDFGDTDDTTGGMYLPGVSNNAYSFQKWLRLSVTTENLAASPAVYSDGSNDFGTGIKIWAAAADSFTSPIEPSTADDPPKLDGVPMVDFFTYTVGSPLQLDDGIAVSSGEFGKWLVLVAEVENTASTGLKVGEDIIFQWIEA